MSYAKWHRKDPNLGNYEDFFIPLCTSSNTNLLWKNYYSQIKEAHWPDCANYQQVEFLPKYMQEEIRQTYQPPASFTIADDKKLLEFLCKCYFDLFCNPEVVQFLDVPRYPISKYFSNDLSIVKSTVENIFGWDWDQDRSNVFHQSVMQQNTKYFLWLNNIKTLYAHTIGMIECVVQLKIWENAIIIAMVCKHFSLDPMELAWDNNDQFLDKTNVSLITCLKQKRKLKKENKHGQAI